jgi:hypothetical protein
VLLARHELLLAAFFGGITTKVKSYYTVTQRSAIQRYEDTHSV